MGQEARPRRDFGMVTLRNDETPLTSDNTETAVTDAVLKDYKQGFGIVAASTLVVNDTDEQYDMIFEGRQEGSGAAYTELGRITLGAAALGHVAPFITPGVFSTSLPNLKGDMRLRTVIVGTTPSIQLNYVGIVATRSRYGHDQDTTIQ